MKVQEQSRGGDATWDIPLESRGCRGRGGARNQVCKGGGWWKPCMCENGKDPGSIGKCVLCWPSDQFMKHGKTRPRNLVFYRAEKSPESSPLPPLEVKYKYKYILTKREQTL